MSKSKSRLIHSAFSKYLAVFMMLCLVTSLMPSSAFAEETAGDTSQTATQQAVETAPAQDVEAAPAPVPSFPIRWVNYDGTPLDIDPFVPAGAMPMYNGAWPTRPADEQYTYEFIGWAPLVHPVNGPCTYVALYRPVLRTYTVTWLDEDGTQLELDEEVPYGTDPSYDGATPTKEADEQYTYEFDGWTPEVVTVTGDATYTATYKPTLRNYTVTWLDEDGTQLELDEEVPYGTDPSYDGATPTKESTAQYDYEFDGWTPEIVTVTGDATYTATYKEILRNYTVTWLDDDGTQLELDEEVPYGETPSYDGETPTKESTAQYDYEFDGWTPEIDTVTGDATYTATYKEITREYTITYVLAGGTLDGKTGSFDEVYPYGTEINLAAAPTREGYTFQYWKGSEYEAGAEYTVTEDHTFTAVWEKDAEKKDDKKDDNKKSDSKKSTKKTATKKVLPATGDDFNAAVPFTFAFMGSMILVAGYALRRRNLHSNR